MKSFLFETGEGDTIPLTVAANYPVSKVKTILSDITKAAPSDLILSYNGRLLQDSAILAESGVPNDRPIKLTIGKGPARRLTVAGPKGRLAKTRFNPAATVRKARDTLARMFGVSGDANLVLGTRVLPLDSLLGEFDIPEDAVLKLEESPKSLPIYAENGKVALTRFKPSVTVGKVREVMSAKLGISPDVAAVRYNGRILDDSETLGELQIPSDGYLEIGTWKKAKRLTIRMLDGSIARSRFTETATVGKMKEVLAETLGTRPENVSLIVNDPSVDNSSFIKDLGVDTIDAKVEPAPVSPVRNITIRLDSGEVAKGRFTEKATVKKVKEVLAETLDMDPGNLTFVRDNDDSALLKDLDIDSDESVEMEVAHAVLFRLSNGKIAKTRFKRNATIGKAKQKLGEALSVPPSMIVLDLDGDDDTFLRNVTFPQDGIVNARVEFELSRTIGSDTMFPSEDEASTGNVSPIRNLTIRVSDGKIAKTRFRETATVGKVREVMAKVLDTAPENVSIPNIDDDNSLVKDLPIPEEGLYMARTSPKIKVVKPLLLKFGDGTMIHCRFRMAATVRKVKETLSNLRKKPVTKIDLFFNHEKLSDGKFLSELDIPDDGFVFVQERN